MREVIDKPIFYVYVLLDPRKAGKFKYGEYEFDYEPFYVGKGSGIRKRLHAQKWQQVCNSHKGRKVNKIMRVTGKYPPVKIVKEGMLESDSFRLEMELIKSIGREELKTGPLTNKSDGGEGQSGWIPDEETRKKLSAAGRGRKPSPESIAAFIKMAKRPKSEEHRRKIGLVHKGKKLSPEHIEGLRQRMLKFKHTEEFKRALSERNKGNTWGKGGKSNAKDFAIRLPDGTTRIENCLSHFCKNVPDGPVRASLHNGSCSKGYWAIPLDKFQELGSDWDKAINFNRDKIRRFGEIRRNRQSQKENSNG